MSEFRSSIRKAAISSCSCRGFHFPEIRRHREARLRTAHRRRRGRSVSGQIPTTWRRRPGEIPIVRPWYGPRPWIVTGTCGSPRRSVHLRVRFHRRHDARCISRRRDRRADQLFFHSRSPCPRHAGLLRLRRGNKIVSGARCKCRGAITSAFRSAQIEREVLRAVELSAQFADSLFEAHQSQANRLSSSAVRVSASIRRMAWRSRSGG